MTYGGMNMVLDPSLMVWKAEGIPTMPYDDNMAVKPYPMAQITAKDSNGNVLATATVVLNVSDEMSCANCHGPNTNPAAMPSGGWITAYNANQNMRLNILKKHDDRWILDHSGDAQCFAGQGLHDLPVQSVPDSPERRRAQQSRALRCLP